MAIRGGPDIIEDSLVCHIDMADQNCYNGSGSTVYDLANNTTTGTISGATFVNNNGGAISFDSSTETVELNKKAENLGIWSANLNFSIAVWFMDESNGSSAQVLFGNESGYNSRVVMMLHTNYRFYPFVRAGSGQTTGMMSPENAYEPNTWNYGVFTFAKSPSRTIYSYLNGEYIGSGYNASMESSALFYYNVGNVPLRLGRAHHSYAYTPLTGKIASVSVYNKTLTLQEIQQNYNATKGRFGL